MHIGRSGLASALSASDSLGRSPGPKAKGNLSFLQENLLPTTYIIDLSLISVTCFITVHVLV